jgi:nanoRNase/pAp phosphatase (c-di-AMP/oligoRNAs hydrolase)
MFRFTGIPEAEEVAAARQGMRDHRLIVISFSETTQFAIIATQTKKTSLPPDIQITDRIVNIDHHPTRVIVPADFFEEREKSNAA